MSDINLEMAELKVRLIKVLINKITNFDIISIEEERVGYDFLNNEKGSIFSKFTFSDKNGIELIITGTDLDY